MANLKINGLTGSQVLEVKTAVAKIMERDAGIQITEDPDIVQNALADTCQMSFKKKDITYKELSKINNRMGEKFDIRLVHAKDAIQIVLEAPTEAFTTLAHIQMPQRPAIQPGNAPGSQDKGETHEGEGAK